jgi:transcriptional regulator with XRE-family HTH domain
MGAEVNAWSALLSVLTPIQVKLGRTALGLGLRELAIAADVAPSTITRYETGKGGMHTGTLERVQKVLEDGGIIFIAADAAGGPGVRLKLLATTSSIPSS